jgi:hypothetical protein
MLMPPLLWSVSLGALLGVRPDYRGAAVAPTLNALVVTTGLAGLAAVVRAAGLPPAAWILADGLALMFLLVAGFAALLDVDLRVSTQRELLITALLLMLAFGVGATALLVSVRLGSPVVQIAIAALASQFPMLVGTMQGLQATDARQRELMYVLSATRAQTLRYLLVPSALPYLFAGFKIAAPSAVLGAITGTVATFTAIASATHFRSACDSVLQISRGSVNHRSATSSTAETTAPAATRVRRLIA